jgi:DNA-binding GntR family transcriptional regulator
MAKHASESADLPHGNQVYARLLDEMATGQLLPGDRLRETELAARLKVSRTPVREAIRLLETDGLVVHVPRAGATVRQLDYAEVTELYEMRAVLEGTAARLAARTASEIELSELQSINDEMGQTTDGPTAQKLNRVFHKTLLNAAKNRFLHRSTASLAKALMILGPTTLAASERIEDAVEEHQRVLEALRARDGDEAERLMRLHIDVSQKVRLRALREI